MTGLAAIYQHRRFKGIALAEVGSESIAILGTVIWGGPLRAVKQVVSTHGNLRLVLEAVSEFRADVRLEMFDPTTRVTIASWRFNIAAGAAVELTNVTAEMSVKEYEVSRN